MNPFANRPIARATAGLIDILVRFPFARRSVRRLLGPSLASGLLAWHSRLQIPGMTKWLRENRPGILDRINNSDLSPRLREIVLLQIAQDGYRSLEPWTDGDREISTDVLFITPEYSPDMVKDVIALKSLTPDLHCTLIMGHAWLGQERLSRRWFDRVLVYGSAGGVSIINTLGRVSSPVTIIRGARSSLDLVARMFVGGRIIFRSEEWLRSSPDYDQKSDLASIERYILQHCDGVYHFWADDAEPQLREIADSDVPIISLMPRCVDELGPREWLPKLSASDGDPHVVFAGHIGRATGGREHLDKWIPLMEQGVHIHYYAPDPDYYAGGYGDMTRPYQELARANPRFHLEETLEFDEFLTEITRYDWAHMHLEPFRLTFTPGFEAHGSNLLFTYVQAELPLITLPDYWVGAGLVEKYGTGLLVDTSEFPVLREKMEAFTRSNPQERLKKQHEESGLDRIALSKLVGL